MMKYLLTLLLLTGCNGAHAQIPGDGELVVIDLDNDFYTNRMQDGWLEIVAVKAGLHYWNQLGANLHGAYEFGPEDIEKVNHAKHWGLHRDSFSWPGYDVHEAPNGMDWYGLGYSTIYPSVMRNANSYTYEEMRESVSHELGHAIGMYHVSDKNSVMSTAANWSKDKATQADDDEYIRHYSVKAGVI